MWGGAAWQALVTQQHMPWRPWVPASPGGFAGQTALFSDLRADTDRTVECISIKLAAMDETSDSQV